MTWLRDEGAAIRLSSAAHASPAGVPARGVGTGARGSRPQAAFVVSPLAAVLLGVLPLLSGRVGVAGIQALGGAGLVLRPILRVMVRTSNTKTETPRISTAGTMMLVDPPHSDHLSPGGLPRALPGRACSKQRLRTGACQPRARTRREPETWTGARRTTKPVLTSIAAVESRPGIDMVRRRCPMRLFLSETPDQDRALRVPEVGANRRHRAVARRRGSGPHRGSGSWSQHVKRPPTAVGRTPTCLDIFRWKP